MAPTLDRETKVIMKRLVDQGLTNKEIQRQVNTSRKSVSLLRGNLKISEGGFTTKPRLSNGAPRALTADMVKALTTYLLGKPNLELNEMLWWLWDEYGLIPSRPTLSRRLKEAGWSHKVVRVVFLSYISVLTTLSAPGNTRIATSSCESSILFKLANISRGS